MQRIEKRKNYLKRTLPEGTVIDHYPIVNSEKQFSQICSRRDLQNYISKKLKEASVDKRSLAYANVQAQNNPELKQNDPTTYIFRRNFATLLASVCAVDDDELQYLMGHEIESGRDRYEFNDPEILLRMYTKMNRRHILDMHNEIDLLKKNAEYEHLTTANSVVIADNIAAAGKDGMIIDVYNDYPADDLSVSVTQKRDLPDVDISNPVVVLSCDFIKEEPGTVGRISFESAYCRAMHVSHNISKAQRNVKRNRKSNPRP